MTTKTSVGIILVLLFCGLVRPAGAQSEEIASAAMVLPDGTNIQISTFSDPPSARFQASEAQGPTGGGFRRTDKAIHRFFFDHRNRLYFGYDLVVEKLKETGQFRISIGPLSVPPEDLDPYSKREGYISLASVNYPPPQIIDDQDAIMFDVLFNPKTQQKIAEKITVSSSSLSYKLKQFDNSLTMVKDDLTLLIPDQAPRDFRLDDVKLKVSNPFLSINGQVVFSAKGATVSSTMLWLSVPGRGRFLLSINPREGYRFEKAGFILYNLVSIQLDGEQYLLHSDVPILDATGNWYLYVLRQPSYRMSSGEEVNYDVGATNQIE
jgi:hypothetical protein